MAVANRKSIIRQYDEVNRQLTWLTLSADLPAWNASLGQLFAAALSAVAEDE